MNSITRHYEALTPTERFTLTIEAMGRRDDAEADRLGDTCPRFLYRLEDAEFRDRMRRAYSIAATVRLNMREGLAQIRMAAKFRALHRTFSGPVTQSLPAAYLCGREHGRDEATVSIGPLPATTAALAESLARDAELQEQMPELTVVAQEATLQVADTLHYAVGEMVAVDLLSQWEGFTTFCRDALRTEPLTLTRALGLGVDDPEEKVRREYLNAEPDASRAAEWALRWTHSWRRRFAARGER